MKNNRNIKILIATGIYPPDVGGPAQYAKNLAEEFGRQGNSVKILSYQTEKKLPPILRHFFYFFKVLFNLPGSGLVVALDTFSVGLPAVAAARIMGKKQIVRVGGAFLWESFTGTT